MWKHRPSPCNLPQSRASGGVSGERLNTHLRVTSHDPRLSFLLCFVLHFMSALHHSSRTRRLCPVLFLQTHTHIHTNAHTAPFQIGGEDLLENINTSCGAYCSCTMSLTAGTMKDPWFRIRAERMESDAACIFIIPQTVRCCYFSILKAQNLPHNPPTIPL